MYTDDPVYGPQGPAITRQYAEVVARRRALYSEQPATRPKRNFIFYDKVVLPLSADGTHINMLFCAADMLVGTPALRAGTFREVWGDPVEK